MGQHDIASEIIVSAQTDSDASMVKTSLDKETHLISEILAFRLLGMKHVKIYCGDKTIR